MVLVPTGLANNHHHHIKLREAAALTRKDSSRETACSSSQLLPNAWPFKMSFSVIFTMADSHQLQHSLLGLVK